MRKTDGIKRTRYDVSALKSVELGRLRLLTMRWSLEWRPPRYSITRVTACSIIGSAVERNLGSISGLSETEFFDSVRARELNNRRKFRLSFLIVPFAA